MSFFKRNKFGIILTYLNSIFIISLFKKCYDIQKLSYLLVTGLFIISLIIYFVFSEILWEDKKRFYVIATILFLGIFLVFIFREDVYNFVTKDIVYNIVTINQLVADKRPTFFNQYKYIIAFVFPPIIILFLSLSKNLKLNFIVYINLLFMMFFYYIGYDKLIRGSMILFIAANIVALGINEHNMFLKYTRDSNVRNSIKDSTIIFKVISLAMVIAIIINILPLDKEGKYQAIIEDKMSSVMRTNGIGAVDIEGKYDLSYSGYNNSSKILGGSVNIDSSRVLKVKGDYRGLYLRGSVKDYYDGSSWQNTSKEYSRIDIEKPYLGENTSKISIEQLSIETNTLFTPLKTINVELEGRGVYKDSIDNSFLSKTDKKNVYEVEYLKEGSPIIIDNPRLDKDIKEMYLQVPDIVTERTKELTRNITKDKNTSYEKAMAIKDYLEKNCSYSTSVGSVQVNGDFVDNFLFNDKRGYCVYFASALTVMSRIAGVPARYVEGFKIGEKTRANEELYVTNEDAHAWTEICINETKDRWISIDASATITEQTQGTLHNESENTGDNQINPENIKDQVEEKTSNEELNVEKEDRKDLKSFVYISLISGLITYIIFRFLKAKSVKKGFRGYVEPSDLYQYSLRILRLTGIEKKKYMTDLEFAYSIKDKKIRETIINLVQYSYGEYYGGEKSFIKGEKTIEVLDEYLKKHLSKTKYYSNKYFGK